MTDDIQTQDAKNALRAEAQATRARVAETVGGETGAAAVAAAIIAAVDAGDLKPARPIVSGYLPLGAEIDPRPTMTALAERGWTMALPVVVAKDTPLEFRAWTPDAPLENGSFRTRHPAAGSAVVDPGLILSPLLAFDAEGYRLGWGGGFYDRTIAQRRATGGVLFVGCAFSGQEVAACPRGPFDMALDAVVTEGGLTLIAPC